MEQPHDLSPEIRLLGPRDVDVLANVDDDVFDHAVRRELVEAYLADPRNLLIVAVVEGTVVGMASGILYIHPDKPLQCFVNEVGVSARYQGRGIGKRLVHGLLDKARSRGCTEAWVATEEHNIAARALYKATRAKEDADRAVVYTWQLQ